MHAGETEARVPSKAATLFANLRDFATSITRLRHVRTA